MKILRSVKGTRRDKTESSGEELRFKIWSYKRNYYSSLAM
jgi:hypothetical protein